MNSKGKDMIILKKLLLVMFTFLFILSCESTDDKQTLQQIAITLIANYAEGEGPVPTIRNYEDAGIIGVNEKNINELNSFIETLASENIDTEEELNAIIDALSISLSSDIFAPVITLHGPNPFDILQGDIYKKECATAIDKHDGEVTVYVLGDVNTNKLGRYIVKYSAIDQAGNLATVDRIINVVATLDDTPIDNTSPTDGNDPVDGTDTTDGDNTIDDTDSTDEDGPVDDTDSTDEDEPVDDVIATYTIGGVASGLSGEVVLKNNTGNLLSTLTTENGVFTFDTTLLEGDPYNISILFEPAGQTCTLENASGVISSSNIVDITIVCENDEPEITPDGSGTTVSNYFYIHTHVLTPSALTNVSLKAILNSTETLNSIGTTETFSTALQTGDSYTVSLSETLTGAYNEYCNFVGFGLNNTTNMPYPATGTIGTADVTLNITCPGP